MRKVIVLLPLLLSAASAASLCVSGPLTAYLQMPGGCTIGTVLFSDFAFGGIGSGSAIPQQIQVSAYSDNGNPTLSFTGPFVSGPGMYLNDAFTFTVIAPTIAVNMVAAVAATAGAGSAKVNASSDSASPGSQSADQNATLTPGSLAASTDLPAGAPAAITETIQTVSNTISDPAVPDPPTPSPTAKDSGGAGMPGGSDPTVPTPSATVPEPNTVFLVGLGLILCALLLRYSRRKA